MRVCVRVFVYVSKVERWWRCVERSDKKSRNRWDVLNVKKKKNKFGDRFRMETE